MGQERKYRALLSAACALVVLVLAAPASGVVLRSSTGHRFGILLHRGLTPASVSGFSVPVSGAQAAGTNKAGGGSAGTVAYNGGPVLHSSAPRLIFWDPGSKLSSANESLLRQYLTDTAADSGGTSNIFGVLRQYTDSSGFVDYAQTFTNAQAIVDSHQYPSSGCRVTAPASACLTDAQLEDEVATEIQANSLPTGTGAQAPIYFVVTPQNVDVCDDGTGASCASNIFCAYHSYFADGQTGTNVLYGSIPFLVWAQREPKGCQFDGNSAVQSPNGQQADVQISSLSHELSETVTDPLLTAWYSTSSGNEVGDNCAFTGPSDPAQGSSPTAFLPVLGGVTGSSGVTGSLFDQAINGDHYYTQTEWSNGDSNCDAAQAAGTISPSFTPGPGGQANAIAFSPTGSSTNGFSSATWSFGDGATAFQAGGPSSVSHTYPSAGNYTASLTVVDTDGNIATTSQSIAVGAPLAAAFTATPSPAAPGASVAFDGGGTTDPNAGGTITTYSWDFGDGSSVSTSTQTTSHSFAAAGLYTVTLTGTDSYGQVGTVSHQFSVGAAPTAAFTTPTSPVASGAPLTLNGSGSTTPNAGATLASYSWNFGDGTTATSGASVQHTYTAAGTYTITLSVLDSYGLASTTTSQQITVDQPPSASFTGPSILSPGGQASFDASASSDPNASRIVSYSWNFGDGSPLVSGTSATVQHAFAALGTYTVTLKITDGLGFAAQTTRPIRIAAAPNAAFLVAPAVADGSAAGFDASGSTDPNTGVTITSYSWNFGDGSLPATGVSPQHTYIATGTYMVTLTTTDSLGLTDTVSHQVVVAKSPRAAVLSIPVNAAAGNALSFDASPSSDPNPGGSVVRYYWNFGDSSPVANAIATEHTFTAAGSYTVTLVVGDALGLTDVFTEQIVVEPAQVIGVKTRGTQVSVSVNAPGTVTLGSIVGKATPARPAQLGLSLTQRQRRAVRHGHTLRLKFLLTFVPAAGPVQQRRVTVTVRSLKSR